MKMKESLTKRMYSSMKEFYSKNKATIAGAAVTTALLGVIGAGIVKSYISHCRELTRIRRIDAEVTDLLKEYEKQDIEYTLRMCEFEGKIARLDYESEQAEKEYEQNRREERERLKKLGLDHIRPEDGLR